MFYANKISDNQYVISLINNLSDSNDLFYLGVNSDAFISYDSSNYQDLFRKSTYDNTIFPLNLSSNVSNKIEDVINDTNKRFIFDLLNYDEMKNDLKYFNNINVDSISGYFIRWNKGQYEPILTNNYKYIAIKNNLYGDATDIDDPLNIAKRNLSDFNYRLYCRGVFSRKYCWNKIR